MDDDAANTLAKTGRDMKPTGRPASRDGRDGWRDEDGRPRAPGGPEDTGQAGAATTHVVPTVDWMPDYVMEPDCLHGQIDVIMPEGTATPFEWFLIEADMRVLHQDWIDTSNFRSAFGIGSIKYYLAETDWQPDSPERRRLRSKWLSDIAQRTLEANLAKLGTRRTWETEAIKERRRFLARIDDGKPLSARTVASMQRRVPNALKHLGECMPTGEAVEALRSIGRPVHEIGAGIGLFSRALERAGVPTTASDKADKFYVGLAYGVERLVDAETAVARMAKRQDLPTILIAWPEIAARGEPWLQHAFECAAPGQHVALASPEVEHAAMGNLDWTSRLVKTPLGKSWRAVPGLMDMVRLRFDEVAVAPVVGAGWPVGPTPLRIWRRRTTH